MSWGGRKYRNTIRAGKKASVEGGTVYDESNTL